MLADKYLRATRFSHGFSPIFAILTPGGGVLPSGTKKSGASSAVGSTR
jgi:hypothetical protein